MNEIERQTQYVEYLLRNKAECDNAGDASASDEICDELADFFANYQHRDVLNKVSLTGLFMLLECNQSINLVVDCYTLIKSYVADNPEEYELVMAYAENLAFTLLRISLSPIPYTVKIEGMRFMNEALKEVGEAYPDIPMIVIWYAETLLNLSKTYDTSVEKKGCRDSLRKLCEKHPDNDELRKMLEEA